MTPIPRTCAPWRRVLLLPMLLFGIAAPVRAAPPPGPVDSDAPAAAEPRLFEPPVTVFEPYGPPAPEPVFYGPPEPPPPEPPPAPAPPPPAPAAPASAVLRGRVFERGALSPIPFAKVRVGAAWEATCDEQGRFELQLPPGPVEIAVQAPRYEPLLVRETLAPGRRLTVEYRLLPQLTFRSRFVATVRGDARREGDRLTLRDEELRTLPGTLGDPFRVVSLLPGVAAPVPVLPIFVVRGASPGMNGYFLDGMRVPQLFHMLLLGATVHAGLVDRIDFYPGSYDTSFGRFAGGIVDAETRIARPGYHAELQLRLFDLSALGEGTLPGGLRVSISGHYGYPGPLIRAFDPRVDLQFWDYHLRLDWKGLTVQALGSFDYVNITREEVRRGMLRRVPVEFRLLFHRVQARHRHRRGILSTEVGLVGGVDELSAFGGNGVRKLSLALRGNAQLRWRRFRLFAGFEGELSRFTPENFGSEETQAAPDELADFGEGRNGIVGGAFLQATVEPWRDRLSLTLGARADVYHAGNVTLVGVEPRGQFRLKAQDWLSFTLGGGLYQQPPSFPVPLPGIDTFALQLGLQRAFHGSSGLELTLPQLFQVRAVGYYQKFFNINDIVLDLTGPQLCTSPPPESLRGAPALVTRQVDGQSYGMEFMVRRKADRLSGWISYTLGRAERLFSCGLRPADYDQTHVLNVVLQVRLPWRLVAGARLSYTTGRPVTIFEPPDGRSTIRNNSRLPETVQLDLRLDREWRFRHFALAVFLEVVNTTYSQVNFGLIYPEEEVTLPDGRMAVVPRYDTPELNGFRWVLPSAGLRAFF